MDGGHQSLKKKKLQHAILIVGGGCWPFNVEGLSKSKLHVFLPCLKEDVVHLEPIKKAPP
ncbi:hypothetical protein FH972_019535 [Carpinus fangiana]|uniref:Uncharacterized protein n=1 Tax=Carpinus fangiana TaxID=176857 RepID=A0A5N6RTP6_9ROSI|nr:hypothetical protein FH972_019535 [Carpinus fangiana]